jgi:RimJ/RimL family protein N-acetyltransferase
MGNDHWPLFDLEVHTPQLTLRYLDDQLAAELVVVAARGVHDPSTMPFLVPWTDLPSPQMEQEAMRFYWQGRAATRPNSWRLLLAVIADDHVVGSTELMADDFPVLRQFTTGSWLGREFQGRGLGTQMRAASLALGFDGLGAEFALTGAWHDNAASLGVTTSLGYEAVGRHRALRRGIADEQLDYRMRRTHWETIRRDDVVLVGADRARDFLGIR